MLHILSIAAGWVAIPPAQIPNLGPSVLVDIRQPSEFRLDGHIPGSVCVAAYTWEHGFHLPRGEAFIGDLAEAVELADLGTSKVVLLCADGRLSAGAARQLEEFGFCDVAVCDGGLNAYAADEALPALVIDEDGEDGLVGAWV